MQRKAALLVLALTTFSPGCALINDGIYNLCTDARNNLDDNHERKRNRQWAEQWWAQVCGSTPDGYSKEYAQGFKDGFAEYLFSGNSQPPPVAPNRFRNYTYQTPAGYHAIEEWFAGYRQGVSAAVESGYRRFITAPVAVPLPPPGAPPMAAPPPPVPLPAPLPALPDREQLPAPRPTAPDTKPEPKVAPPVPEAPTPPKVTVRPKLLQPLEMTPAQHVVQPPACVAPPQNVVLPPRVIVLPDAQAADRHSAPDWALPHARFGIPIVINMAPRTTGLMGILLPPAVIMPMAIDTDSEEQEPPVLGSPQPREE